MLTNKKSRNRGRSIVLPQSFSSPLIGEDENGMVDTVDMVDPSMKPKVGIVGKGANAFTAAIPNRMVTSLRGANIAALIISAIAWAVTLIILLVYHFGASDHRLISDITQNFRRFGGADSLALGQFIHDPSTFLRSGYSILIPAVAFSLFPAIFHLIIVASERKSCDTSTSEGSVFAWYIAYSVNNSYNSLRWLQYALSYGMIAWIIFQISGVTDVTLMCLMVLVKLGVFGALWIHETVNQKRQRSSINWEPFLLASFLVIVLWAITVAYFLVQVSSAPSPLFTNTPLWMYLLVGGAFVSTVFGGIIMI